MIAHDFIKIVEKKPLINRLFSFVKINTKNRFSRNSVLFNGEKFTFLTVDDLDYLLKLMRKKQRL